MEVKQGYKYTEEFGFIPEDWEIDNLENNIVYFKGYPFNSKNYIKSGRRVIRVSDMTYNKINDFSKIYVSEDEAKKLTKYSLVENDIIITTVGSKPPMNNSLVGRAILVTCKDNYGLLNQNAVCLRAKNNVIQLFLFYLFMSKKYFNFLKLIIRGNANQGNITLANLFYYKLLLPPIYEQKRISQVLRDMDKLIENIGALLEKKRNLKIAAMQKLLTPQPHWEEKKLKDIVGVITTGKLDANAMDKNGIYRFYTCAKEFYWINKYAFEGNAILISGNGANVGYIHYYSGKFNAYQRTYVLQQFYCNDKLLKFFLDKNLSLRIEEELNSSNTPFIKKTTLVDMVIFLPPIQEQQKIAQILSDMDEEIDALEKELEKYRLLKTGAMQELLTGKTRLV